VKPLHIRAKKYIKVFLVNFKKTANAFDYRGKKKQMGKNTVGSPSTLFEGRSSINVPDVLLQSSVFTLV